MKTFYLLVVASFLVLVSPFVLAQAQPQTSTVQLQPARPLEDGAVPVTPSYGALVLVLSDTWTCSPVAALTGEQLNLKTQSFQQGVSLGAGYGCRYVGWKVPLALEAVGGFAANSNAPNAVQGNLIFVVADNYGIGPGTQVFKDPISGSYTGQMLVSFFLTASWAATIEQLKQAKFEAKAEGYRNATGQAVR